MTDYKEGRIYAIKSKDTNEVYIGSTCKPLKIRMSSHVSEYKNYIKTNDPYKKVTSYKILQYDDAYISLIENFPCDTKRDLLNREGYYIRNTPNVVNIVIEGRTIKEWRTDNAVRLKEYRKEYVAKNPELKKKWNNKYYHKHLDKIKTYVQQPVQCECKLSMTKGALGAHMKSKSHALRMRFTEDDRIKITGKCDDIRKNKITCWCGDVVSWGCFKRHCDRKHTVDKK